MDTWVILAGMMALAALSMAIRNNGRLKNLENKLKDFDVIPKDFDSERPRKDA